MKLNNKGFAISTVMYMILVLAVILITLTLSILSSRKLILDKIRKETLSNIYNAYSVTYREALEILKNEATSYATNNSVTKETIKISDLNSSIDQEILDGYELSEKYLTMVLNQGNYDIYLGKSSKVTNVNDVNKFIDIYSYKIYGNSNQKNYSGKNLLNLYDRTAGTLTGTSNSTVRNFDYNKYYIGLSPNNYYNPAGKIYVGYLDGNEWHISSDGVYGIAFPVKVTPNTTYTISGESLRIVASNIYYNIGIGFYDAEGNLLSNTLSVRYLTFTTPANCYTATIILKPDAANTETIHKNIQLELGNTSTSYVKYVGGMDSPNPYYPQEVKSVGDLVTDSNNENYGKYKIPVTVNGKNLLDKSQSSIVAVRQESEVSGWGSIAFDNSWVLANMKPGAQYTLSYDIECVSVPEHDSNFSSNLGLTLYNGSTFTIPPIQQYLSEGESIKVTKTFTAPEDLTNYRIMIYTNRYTLNGVGATSSMIISNLQLEEGETATAYEPYHAPITTNIYLDEPLRKIGDYADYIDFKKGKVIRKIGEKTFSTGGNSYTSSTSNKEIFFLSLILNGQLPNYAPMVNYYSGTTTVWRGLDNNNASVNGGSNTSLWIRDDRFSTAAEFKTYIENLYSSGKPLIADFVLQNLEEESVNLPNIQNVGNYNNLSVATNLQPSKVEFTVIEKIRQL